MPPKKNPGLEEELEEIKKSLNFMSGEITKAATQQEKRLNLMEKVSKLENMVKEKDKKIDNLEQYSGVTDIIIQGLYNFINQFANRSFKLCFHFLLQDCSFCDKTKEQTKRKMRTELPEACV
ncbi:hypothetical protein ILYODFUR_025258 [Ilyodon furcidens]|uniref:Uncharacterized protein n=1 Tax=Ilyodon furcidens TaxID=33524 RepID=A0ABV0U8C6_9TELE